MFFGNENFLCDLNIPLGSNCEKVCETAAKLGYRVLGLNSAFWANDIFDSQSQGKGKNKNRKLEDRTGGSLSSLILAQSRLCTNGEVPSPSDFPWIEQLQTQYPGLHVLRRLTIVFSQMSHLQQILNQKSIADYDVIAVIPVNNEALQQCIVANGATFDIISFDLEGPYWIDKLKIKHGTARMARERGIVFELTYSPSLHGDDPLGNLIYAANCLRRCNTKSSITNLILSSGAGKPGEVRASKDLYNLGFLLGLSEAEVWNALYARSCRLLSKSRLRRFGKTSVVFFPGAHADRTIQSSADNSMIDPAVEISSTIQPHLETKSSSFVSPGCVALRKKLHRKGKKQSRRKEINK